MVRLLCTDINEYKLMLTFLIPELDSLFNNTWTSKIRQARDNNLVAAGNHISPINYLFSFGALYDLCFFFTKLPSRLERRIQVRDGSPIPSLEISTVVL